MQELRLVAVSEDGTYLVLATAGRGTRFTLPVDDRLRAAVRGNFSRLGQYEIEVESPLRPKEIQARIRAGETADEIAATAGIPVERVRWFEGPVLQEREYVAQQAQRCAVRLPGDSAPGPTLGDLVAERLTRRGVHADEIDWDSAKRDDNLWRIKLGFVWNGHTRHAEWLFDPRRRHITPHDDEAMRLSASDYADPVEDTTVTPFVPRVAKLAPVPPLIPEPLNQPPVSFPTVLRQEPPATAGPAYAQPEPAVPQLQPEPPAASAPPESPAPPYERPPMPPLPEGFEAPVLPAVPPLRAPGPDTRQTARAPEPAGDPGPPMSAEPPVTASSPVAADSPVATESFAAAEPSTAEPSTAGPLTAGPAAPEPDAGAGTPSKDAVTGEAPAAPVTGEPAEAAPAAVEADRADAGTGPESAQRRPSIPAPPAQADDPPTQAESASEPAPEPAVEPTVEPVAEPAAEPAPDASIAVPPARVSADRLNGPPQAEPASKTAPGGSGTERENQADKPAAEQPAAAEPAEPPVPTPPPAPVPKPAPARPAKKARGRRASVPTWDEIMFGARRPD
ncbi:DUF3071 domain-containing protein [Planomonospora sp. ID67723]|uniref:septation protein SepH n=1 Tax=Planomonospora sp. ID67723 TaxID=2738134 RepID=UPI0018C3BBDC|nr:septation protein SepH [Planomonospora sp. ID67723]MBG0830790.1 DUF3071 domain-containing protein [Planomonospora sp. ID67723]